MKITRKDVDYVAALARLELTEDEAAQLEKQLDAILTYIDQLNELDTAGVEPMAQVLAEAHPDAALRDDAPKACLPHDEALAPAPDKDETFFKVPKVIDR